ncbi:MAG: hypothetical protein ACI38R_22295 [Rhodococcus sp. (in: high G+C Gram-positive bacteria)]|uniref:hypothetical protein n=2 Tax=Nocardiaceae TaxID=85025 RepID=UPI00110E1EF7|nr:hypothetical protein [Rhodococcus pyridinivorans]
MNKKILGASASAVAAVAAVGLLNTGTAGAATSLGPTTNSCAPGGGAAAPVAVAGGVFIADPNNPIPTGVHVSSVGTGSLNGDVPGKAENGGIMIPTTGIGVGTVSGTYVRQIGANPPESCSVNGIFLLP